MANNKQYISIIRLFDHCGLVTEGEINVSRIKKQLNAEFDFAKTGFIEIEGYSYNKNDVLEEIEKVNFEERLQYHKRIWKNKNILTVLEDNAVNLYDIPEAFNEFQQDTAFDEFFSPYFAGPFNHICRGFINDHDLYDLGRWLSFEPFLLPPEREEGFKSIRVFLEESMRAFKNISKENYNSFRPKIADWITPGWEKFLNNLPDEFYHFKNEITVDLINLTVKIQKSEKKDCRAISSGLMGLKDMPSNLVDTIYSNDKVYNKATSPSNYGWIIWVAFILIKVIAFGGCN